MGTVVSFPLANCEANKSAPISADLRMTGATPPVSNMTSWIAWRKLNLALFPLINKIKLYKFLH
jgi:hypothetical protein